MLKRILEQLTESKDLKQLINDKAKISDFWPDNVSYNGENLNDLINRSLIDIEDNFYKEYSGVSGLSYQQAYWGYDEKKDQFVVFYDCWFTEQYTEIDDDGDEYEEEADSTGVIEVVISVDKKVKVISNEMIDEDTMTYSSREAKKKMKSLVDIMVK